MSSFDNDDFDSDDVRLPDNIRTERLIDVNEEEENNQNDSDLEIALQKSIEEYVTHSNNQPINETVDEEYEKMIHQSILEECERIERIQKEEEKIKEMYEKECIEFKSKKEAKYKYFINKLTYIIKDEIKRNNIIHIIKNYINTPPNEKYTCISNEEYELFNKFMNYIYIIPIAQNRRSPLNKDDAEELINNIIVNVINSNKIEFNYINDETYIKEINQLFN